jgi:hypothetical protein
VGTLDLPGPAAAQGLLAWARGSDGLVRARRVHLQGLAGIRPEPTLHPPEGLGPQAILDLSPDALDDPGVRTGILSHTLFGRWVLDPQEAARLARSHPMLVALSLQPTAVELGDIAAAWRLPDGSAALRVLGALLELCGPSAPTCRLHLEIVGFDRIWRDLELPPSFSRKALGVGALAFRCRRCGAEGVGLRRDGGGLDADATTVAVAFQKNSPDKRFLVLSPKNAAGQPPGIGTGCPRCGAPTGPQALRLPESALQRAIGQIIALVPNSGLHHDRSAARVGLLRAVRGGQWRWPDRSSEWAEELGIGADRGLSLERLGLLAVGVEGANRLSSGLGAILCAIARLMRLQGALDTASVRRALAHPLPEPFRLGPGVSAPEPDGGGPLAEALGDAIAPYLPPGEAPAAVLKAYLQKGEDLRLWNRCLTPAGPRLLLQPSALEVRADTPVLSCPVCGLRRVFIPAEIGHYRNGACPRRGCDGRLSPGEAAWSACVRLLEAAAEKPALPWGTSVGSPIEDPACIHLNLPNGTLNVRTSEAQTSASA